jgi:hypothetical protein
MGYSPFRANDDEIYQAIVIIGNKKTILNDWVHDEKYPNRSSSSLTG